MSRLLSCSIPGHEVTGVVAQVGSEVKRFKVVGDPGSADLHAAW